MEGNQTWVKEKSRILLHGYDHGVLSVELTVSLWCDKAGAHGCYLSRAYFCCYASEYVMDSGAEWKFITIYKERVLRMENGRNLIVLDHRLGKCQIF